MIKSMCLKQVYQESSKGFELNESPPEKQLIVPADWLAILITRHHTDTLQFAFSWEVLCKEMLCYRT